MPPKRQNIGRRTRRAYQRAAARKNEDADQRAQRTDAQQIRQAKLRANQTDEERQLHNMENKLRMRRNREIQYRKEENKANDDAGEASDSNAENIASQKTNE